MLDLSVRLQHACYKQLYIAWAIIWSAQRLAFVTPVSSMAGQMIDTIVFGFDTIASYATQYF